MNKLTKNIILLINTLIINVKSIGAEHKLNELPMYGGQHYPKVSENQGVSKELAQIGWDYLYKGDYFTAAKKFNQAWIFDRNNHLVYWGFGAIMWGRSVHDNTEINLKESIKLLNKALESSKDSDRIMVDVGHCETMLGVHLKDNGIGGYQECFDRARQHYINSKALNDKNPCLYSNWSALDYYEENYIDADKKFKLAKKMGFEPHSEYEKDLEQKLNSR